MQTLEEIKKTKDVFATRVDAAKKDLKRLNKEIEPFVRKRPIRRVTTAGKWMESSCQELPDK